MHVTLSHPEMLALLTRAMGVPVDSYTVQEPTYGQIYVIPPDDSWDTERAIGSALIDLYEFMDLKGTPPGKKNWDRPIGHKWLTEGEATQIFAQFRGSTDRAFFVWRTAESEAARTLAT